MSVMMLWHLTKLSVTDVSLSRLSLNGSGIKPAIIVKGPAHLNHKIVISRFGTVNEQALSRFFDLCLVMIP